MEVADFDGTAPKILVNGVPFGVKHVSLNGP